MKKFLAVLMMTWLFCFTAQAKAFAPASTGRELLEYCKIAMDIHDKQFGNPQTQPEYILGTQTGICEGYLMSANEMRFEPRNHPAFCLPPDYTLLTGASAVVKYLKHYTNQQDLPASFVVRRALKMYFPCMRG